MVLIDVITRLGKVTSRSAKEKLILEAYAANCIEFFQAMQLALDPFVMFPVKKVAAILEDDGFAGELSFADFQSMCLSLTTRDLTPDAVRDTIHRAAEKCHAPTWNLVYRRILLKDVGEIVDAELVNRTLRKLGDDAGRFHIATFQPQHAALTGKLAGRRLVDMKISGTRMLAVLDGFPRMHLANGGVADEGNQALQSLRSLTEHLPTSLVLDGVLQGETFNVFDAIPLSDFRAGRCEIIQRDRRIVLEGLQKNGAFPDPLLVKVVPQIDVDFGGDVGQAAFGEFCQHALSLGRDAVVAKKPDAPYIGRRNSAWLKKNIRSVITNT